MWLCKAVSALVSVSSVSSFCRNASATLSGKETEESIVDIFFASISSDRIGHFKTFFWSQLAGFIFVFLLIPFFGIDINLLFWIIPMLILDYSKKKYSEKTMMILLMTKEINKWMFLFNMIPIPPLDGSKVLYPLFGALF